MRALLWRGMINSDVSGQTIAEHEAIYRALRSRDRLLAQSTALIHVDTSESWLRTLLAAAVEEPSD